MYGGAAVSSNMVGEEKEEYLLGKKRVDNLVETAPNVEELSAVNVFSATAASIYGTTANSARDTASKIRDDPLLSIKRREKVSLDKILSNPLRIREIQKLEKKAKKEKKEKKEKKKKHKKRESHERNDDR